jgi:hypothetical protein
MNRSNNNCREPLEEIAKNNMIDWIWDIKNGKATVRHFKAKSS